MESTLILGWKHKFVKRENGFRFCQGRGLNLCWMGAVTEMTKAACGAETGHLELQPWEPGPGEHVAKPGPERIEILGNSLLKDQTGQAGLFLDSKLQLWAYSRVLASSPCHSVVQWERWQLQMERCQGTHLFESGSVRLPFGTGLVSESLNDPVVEVGT